MQKLHVVEVFETIQGEGSLSGCAAVFVRFTGCNMWSGHAQSRERDATRNYAECPRWCDTAFTAGAEEWQNYDPRRREGTGPPRRPVRSWIRSSSSSQPSCLRRASS